MKFLLLILFSSGLLASEPLKEFCSDSVFLIHVLKAKDVFEQKTLGKTVMDFREKIMERPDLKEQLTREKRKMLTEYKQHLPKWACDVEQVPETMEALYREGQRRADLCLEAKNPKRIASELSLKDARPVHPDDLAKEIDAAWKITLGKALDLQGLSQDHCAKNMDERFKGVGARYLGIKDEKARCLMLLDYSNFLSSNAATCENNHSKRD